MVDAMVNCRSRHRRRMSCEVVKTSSIATRAMPMRRPISCVSLAQRAAAQTPRTRRTQMAAVEQGDREQIHQADRDREPRGEAEQLPKADFGHLSSHLGGADHAGNLVGRFPPGENADDIGPGRLDDEPFLLARPRARSAAGRRLDLDVRWSADEARPRWPMRRLPNDALSRPAVIVGVAVNQRRGPGVRRRSASAGPCSSTSIPEALQSCRSGSR